MLAHFLPLLHTLNIPYKIMLYSLTKTIMKMGYRSLISSLLKLNENAIHLPVKTIMKRLTSCCTKN